MATWTDDIVTALESIGGTGTYPEIYDAIERLRSELPASWKNIVQRTIQDHSSDSQGFKGGEDLFYSVDGLGRGVWGLRSGLPDMLQR